MSDRIGNRLSEEVASIAREVARQGTDASVPHGYETYAAAATGFQVGLDVGLAIGIQDIADARRLIAWIDDHIDRDPRARDDRERAAQRLLEVLR